MSHGFKLNLNAAPRELQAGLQIIARDYPRRFSGAAGARAVTFIPQAAPGLQVAAGPDGISIRYRTRTDAFRALGRLLGAEPRNPAAMNFSETAAFDTMGLMLDVSRNGVYLPGTLEQFILQSALMGLNMLMLYTEDTYEVPGHPFFGYLRGRYTARELRALDRYAGALGVEMIPCIQTLGHLEQILQWPAYSACRDTDKVLLAQAPCTSQLLEEMIAAAAAPYQSKRIHIGMDEAHGIGSGRFRKLFGEKRPFDILNRHLRSVRNICRNQGLRPMIWSDMYFRLGSKINSYYDENSVIPREVTKAIPRGVDLVYWDYYHHDTAFYEKWIARHRAMGAEPVMAGGIYTWSRFWTALPWTFNVTQACMQACRKTRLREVFMTMWGDDGAEHNLFSALPGVQFFAEHVYAGQPDPARMRTDFRAICRADFDAFVQAAELDAPGYLRRQPVSLSAANLSKALLWQDPLLAIIDPQVSDPPRLARHYRELAPRLARAAKAAGLNAHLRHPALLARALAIKVMLRRNLAAAYRTDNRAALKKIADTDLPELRRTVRQLWRAHRAYWLAYCKPHGWETVERRYGGLIARLDSLAERLDEYLARRTSAIPELDEKLEPIWPKLAEHIVVHYPRGASPSCIK